MSLLRIRLLALVRYIVFSIVIMLVLTFSGKSPLPIYYFLIFAAFFGLIVGIYREVFGFHWFNRWHFVPRLIAELGILQILIMTTLFVNRLVLEGFDLNIRQESIYEVLFSQEALASYANIQIYGLILLFVIELEKTLGMGFFGDYISGRYRSPKRENRVVMFLDLADSTRLAEELGDDKYYSFINYCFKLLSHPALLHHAEVLKYVGDEVILSWRIENETSYQNYILFFQDYLKTLNDNKPYFHSKYGIFPSFRAGVHSGEVIVAFIGDIKRQKDLSGDVMNTAARICGEAKEFETQFLVSEEVLNKTPLFKKEFDGPHPINVRGKANSLNLYKHNAY